LILSIESSCDDSSIAITEIRTKKILFSKKISQAEIHNQYGGVVPELASRLHLDALTKILEEIKIFIPKLKAVAVTNEPGLIVTLIEGVTMAKAISIALQIPIIGVNHLKGHIYSLFIEKEKIEYPMLILLVSGGHTQLIEMKNWDSFKIIISTLDDSLGESFDKVSKMLGLDYPGGPIIEQLAKQGDKNRFNFPIPLYQSPKLAFSYSGLKNAIRIAISKIDNLTEQDKKDISASFQNVATLHIIHKLKKYLKQNRNKFSKFGIVGGVSANQYIRKELQNVINSFNMELISPKLKYCSDNGEMIGRFAIEKFLQKEFNLIQNIKIKSRSLL
jgi:N6-L-threonylcarbamoyladenine synthase